MSRGTDAAPDPAADAYLRVSRAGSGRYTTDLWLKHPQGYWQSECELPKLALDHVKRVLRDIYYLPYADDLYELAGELWNVLIPDSVRGLLSERWKPAESADLRHGLASPFGGGFSGPEDQRIRIELRDPTLHYLPWEYLPVDAWVPAQLSTYPARYLSPEVDLGTLRVELPLRILFVAASPSMSKMAIDVSAEYNRMAEALEEIGQDRVEVIPLLDPDHNALAAALSASWFHILHISAHGMVGASGPMLALQSRQRSQFLAPTEVGALARASGVRLLTLQTPFTAINYQIAAFAGFAAQVQVLGLPGLLFDLIQDTQRIPTVARVYASLAEGMALDAACRQADAAAAGEPPVLGLCLHTRHPQLFRITPPAVTMSPELLESVSSSLYNLVVDDESQGHKQLMEMVESGATEDEVAQMLSWQVTASAVDAIPLSGDAVKQIARAMAHQAVTQPQHFGKGLNLRALQEASQAERQQTLQELDYVSGNVAQLEAMQATYKAAPQWLEAELASQRERLTQLHDELEGQG